MKLEVGTVQQQQEIQRNNVKKPRLVFTDIQKRTLHVSPEELIVYKRKLEVGTVQQQQGIQRNNVKKPRLVFTDIQKRTLHVSPEELIVYKRKLEVGTVQQQQEIQRNNVKKPRLVFTDIQKRTLHAIFKETQRPSKEMQQTIAEHLGLDLTTVQNFFMNARRRCRDRFDKQADLPAPNQERYSVTPPPAGTPGADGGLEPGEVVIPPPSPGEPGGLAHLQSRRPGPGGGAILPMDMDPGEVHAQHHRHGGGSLGLSPGPEPGELIDDHHHHHLLSSEETLTTVNPSTANGGSSLTGATAAQQLQQQQFNEQQLGLTPGPGGRIVVNVRPAGAGISGLGVAPKSEAGGSVGPSVVSLAPGGTLTLQPAPPQPPLLQHLGGGIPPPGSTSTHRHQNIVPSNYRVQAAATVQNSAGAGVSIHGQPALASRGPNPTASSAVVVVPNHECPPLTPGNSIRGAGTTIAPSPSSHLKPAGRTPRQIATAPPNQSQSMVPQPPPLQQHGTAANSSTSSNSSSASPANHRFSSHGGVLDTPRHFGVQAASPGHLRRGAALESKANSLIRLGGPVGGAQRAGASVTLGGTRTPIRGAPAPGSSGLGAPGGGPKEDTISRVVEIVAHGSHPKPPLSDAAVRQSIMEAGGGGATLSLDEALEGIADSPGPHDSFLLSQSPSPPNPSSFLVHPPPPQLHPSPNVAAALLNNAGGSGMSTGTGGTSAKQSPALASRQIKSSSSSAGAGLPGPPPVVRHPPSSGAAPPMVLMDSGGRGRLVPAPQAGASNLMSAAGGPSSSRLGGPGGSPILNVGMGSNRDQKPALRGGGIQATKPHVAVATPTAQTTLTSTTSQHQKISFDNIDSFGALLEDADDDDDLLGDDDDDDGITAEIVQEPIEDSSSGDEGGETAAQAQLARNLRNRQNPAAGATACNETSLQGDLASRRASQSNKSSIVERGISAEISGSDGD